MAYGRVNVVGLSKTKEREYQRKIANLSAVADIYDNRTVGATGVWYDLLDGTNDYSKGQLDTTSTRTTQALTIGETVLTGKVESTAGFNVGQEITIQDDVNKENVHVTAIAPNLEVTALTKAYKKNANVYRSNVISDTSLKTMRIGNYEDIVTYDKTTPVSVEIAQITSANSRPQVLSNGWIVICVHDTPNTDVYWHVSKDNGTTWEQLCKYTDNPKNQISMTSKGTMVYTCIGIDNGNSDAVRFFWFDAITQSNEIVTTTEHLATLLPDTQNTSIAISNDGTEICATWSAITQTRPNSFNIFTRRGSIGSDGIVTWQGVDEVTTTNTQNHNNNQPVVTYLNNGIPIILWAQKTTFYSMQKSRFVSGSWESPLSIYNGGSYDQSSPQIIVQRYGANIGRIWCVWQGTDSIDTSYYNARIKYSDDEGVNWANGGITNEKLTSGNSYVVAYPTITEDKHGDIYIGWHGNDSSNPSGSRIKMIKRTVDTWGAIENITTNTTGLMRYLAMCKNYYNFEKPVAIWTDLTNSRVEFYGKWEAGQSIPLLNSDVRYNISPESPSNEIVAWVDHEDDAGFSIDAELSVVTGSANEAYSPMTRTIKDLGETHEDEFVGVKSTKGDNVTVKFTLTRTNTNIDKSVTKVLGAIGE